MRVEYDDQTDDWLLQQYVLSRNQDAFAVLVRRYGPMVWGICRRIVRHTQDTEDALQATFAVLARKARSIRRQRTIGGWLHQVARRIALRARANSNRRNAVMPVAVSITAVEPAVEPAIPKAAVDHSDILDDEISRLPVLLRLPIILCYLEGLTNRQAAERLGCTEGTVVSRLARGRAKLRLGLTRRGVILGGMAALTAFLAEIVSAAPLPPELSQKALACGLLPPKGSVFGGSILTAGASRLADATLKAMNQSRFVGYVALIACVLGLTGVVLRTAGLALPFGGRLFQFGVQGQPGDPARNATNLQIAGIWQGEDLEFVGGATPDEHAELSRDCRWVVSGQKIQFKWKDAIVLSAGFQMDSSSTPNAIDIRPTDPQPRPGGETLLGAFRRDLSVLEVCTAEVAGRRPGNIRAGIVATPEGDATEIRAGLVGYAKLRRIDRSIEAEELQGKWVLEHMEASGTDYALDDQRRQGALFDNGSYTLYHVQDGNVLEIRGTYTLDPSRPAEFMEMNPLGGQSFSCLYQIEGDTLRLVGAAPGSARPKEFKTEPGQMHMSWVFRRAKPVEGEAARIPPP